MRLVLQLINFRFLELLCYLFKISGKRENEFTDLFCCAIRLEQMWMLNGDYKVHNRLDLSGKFVYVIQSALFVVKVFFRTSLPII